MSVYLLRYSLRISILVIAFFACCVAVALYRFKYIRKDRNDKELFICEENVGKIFKRKKRYTIVDEESCTGLEWITGLNGVVEIGSFRMR